MTILLMQKCVFGCSTGLRLRRSVMQRKTRLCLLSNLLDHLPFAIVQRHECPGLSEVYGQAFKALSTAP